MTDDLFTHAERRRDDGMACASTPRKSSPVYGCPRLKTVIVDAALKGEITEAEAADLFVQYGLRSV